jgi:hypothetical protein
MPSYQATASTVGADGKTELCASHEFEAPDTIGALALSDTWARSESQIAPGPISIRLYAGKVLLYERTSPGGVWGKVNRP